MAIWSKTKQQLETFLAPELLSRVSYQAGSYRYAPDKTGKCSITVDKNEVFRMNDPKSDIKWYQTSQEVICDPLVRVTVLEDEIEALRKEFGGKVPEERLLVIARQRKTALLAKSILEEQAAMAKSDFSIVANQYLSTPIEESLTSNQILLNILAIIDRRVGKNRLKKMRDVMYAKHPIVQYFYELRCCSKN